MFAVFLVHLFRRAGAARRIGRALAALRDPVARYVRPLGWGLTAALVWTLASNVFYLTMSFYYFFASGTARAGGAGRLRPRLRPA